MRSLMKIMISLKTYSSLPLTAAEEKEEEEFSVKARYNAEREREKNAGGPPSIYCKCNCTTATAATGKWRGMDRVVFDGDDATGGNYAADTMH